MIKSALAHLVDPESLKPLELHPKKSSGEKVEEGELSGSGSSYPIVGGIPSFVPLQVASDQTVRSFAQKWEKHQYYRAHTEAFYTDWYLERYQLGSIDGLRDFLEGKKFILDAGTGAGRDSANFARYSSATVFGVDTSLEALAAFSRQEAARKVNLVNADVNFLPFPDEFFDLISCDQVIHHTPDPPKTFENLRKKLKTGGQVCCYVYRQKGAIREYVDDYIRELIADKPIEEALEICDGITKLGRAFARLKANVEIEEDIPILGIQKGTVDVQRFLHWNVMKCFWNEDFDFFTNNIINVDWYHPRYCFRYTPEQFRAWFSDGWEIQAWDEREAGISCRAIKR